MEPMLRQNRDLVVIQVPFLRVRRFDVDGVVKKIMCKKSVINAQKSHRLSVTFALSVPIKRNTFYTTQQTS